MQHIGDGLDRASAKRDKNRRRRWREVSAGMVQCRTAREFLTQLANPHSWASKKKRVLEEFFGTGVLNPWIKAERESSCWIA
jgi:hypothetical protein